MNCQFITQQVPAFSGLDRIDVADNVRNGHVGRGELFDETCVATNPVDRSQIAFFIEHSTAVSGDWSKRIVVDFGARDDRNALVEQIG
jgi:hypothetical protein